jgi:hypothetical protein
VGGFRVTAKDSTSARLEGFGDEEGVVLTVTAPTLPAPFAGLVQDKEYGVSVSVTESVASSEPAAEDSPTT